jgi:hypothetical protein
MTSAPFSASTPWTQVNFLNLTTDDPNATGIAGFDIFKLDADGRAIEHGTCCKWPVIRRTPLPGSPRTSPPSTQTACSRICSAHSAWRAARAFRRKNLVGLNAAYKVPAGSNEPKAGAERHFMNDQCMFWTIVRQRRGALASSVSAAPSAYAPDCRKRRQRQGMWKWNFVRT